MPKQKNHKNNKPQGKQRNPIGDKDKYPKKPDKHNLWLIIRAVIGAFVSTIGFLALFSNISVEALMPLKRGDLKTVPIQIANNSFVSIYDVSYICKVREIKNPQGGKIIAYEGGITPHGFVINKLDRNETTTTGLPFTFEADPIVAADFDFVVIYKPFWLSPFSLKKSFRFASALNDKGEIFLLHRSTSEK